ncbi:ANTAR domain-containing protein [Nocardia uniformis]|uniref:histidine kinase n=1 Tax=Nocardia uniformis TaxID=53432 RepID=A0A849BXR1_9NOCA|nr:ANTAR domain-containing protein [Nocardia uniformis]
MTDELDGVEQVVGAGVPESVGAFRFWFADQRWEWSDAVAALYGYSPGEVRPTTELLLSHQHPEDRGRVEAELVASVRDHAPFSSRHRITGREGHTHHVIVVSQPLTDDAGEVIGTEGYFIDVTDALDGQCQRALDEIVPSLVEHRAVIEQAKGMLMLVYGVSADQAFRVLTWRSQETQIKVRELAVRLVDRMREIAPAVSSGTRARFDQLLLNLHR